MLNKAPIIVNGFNRGGTNLLQFFLLSHPAVCTVGAELHEVFYGRSTQPVKKWLDRAAYLPVLAVARQHVFLNRCYDERRGLPLPMLRYIDFLLYRRKLGSVMNRSKAENVAYSRAEVEASRLLCKCTNGVCFASEILSTMYPDATFVALVRNGLALCEGYVRRGWTAEAFGDVYERVCQKMLDDSRNIDNYAIVRFDEMVADPPAFIRRVYGHVGLDLGAVPKFRMRAKQSMDAEGNRTFTFFCATRFSLSRERSNRTPLS